MFPYVGGGVDLPVLVAVANGAPLGAARPVFGAAHGISLGGHEGVDERGQHQPPSKSSDAWAMCSCKEQAVSLPAGAVVAAIFGVWASNAEDHAVAAPTPNGPPVTGPSHTTLVAPLQLMSLRLLVRVMVSRSDSDRPPQMP